MNDENKKNLVKTIEESGEWERISTSVEGLYVVKPPESNNRQMIYLELVPVSNNQVLKKKGVFIRTIEELDAFREIFENPKTKELLQVINEYYGIKRTPKIEI